MRQIFTLILVFLIAATSCAQIVECSPEFPTAVSQDITITFHADRGTAGLKGYTGDVYIHTGVIMKNSTSWTHVKADWSKNLPACKLTRTATNTYTLSMNSIKDFYGLTDSEAAKVDKLAMVFRSSDGKKEGKETGGKDIYLQVYEANKLSITIKSPAQNPLFVDAGAQIEVEISASEACSIKYGDTELTDSKITIKAAESGVHTLDFVANNGKASASLTYIVRKAADNAEMPKGLRRGVNAGADGSATFVLYAPGKTSAYVIGDFSNWTITQQCEMQRSGDYLFCTIPGLDKSKEYGYQYIVDENIRIADPYTEKILDPDNDKYIPADIYPGLSYPEGKTTGIVSTFCLANQKYEFKNSFQAPEVEDLVIYELLIRDFTSEGSIKAAQSQLDYLEALGINAIELLPFSEFEGNDSWGYNPSFYFAADKAYGTPSDYKAFIDECHKRGIAVIQDIVLNHSFSQSPLVQLYMNGDKASAQNPWYNVSSPNTAYSWGYDFNHESAETQQLVDSIMAYWISEYNVDGYRFDFTKGFTNTKGDGQAYDASRIKILERIYDQIKSLKPNAYMICEHLTDAKEEKELSNYGIMLWKNVNYAFCQSAMGWESGCGTNAIYYKSISYPQNNVVAYAESHDEERLAYKCKAYGNASASHNVKDTETYLKRLKGAAIILLSAPGPKMIWQFGEIGYDYSINYNPSTGKSDSDDGRTARKPLISNAMSDTDRKALYDTYAMMNRLRAQNDAMKTSDATVETNGLMKVVYRPSDKANLIFATNLGVESASQTIKFPKTGKWYNILSGKEINVQVSETSITYQPGESAIYSDTKTDISTPTHDIELPSVAKVEIYPNPVQSECKISAENISEIQILAANGTMLQSISHISASEYRLNIQNLAPGIYLLGIKTDNGNVAYSKIIKE